MFLREREYEFCSLWHLSLGGPIPELFKMKLCPTTFPRGHCLILAAPRSNWPLKSHIKSRIRESRSVNLLSNHHLFYQTLSKRKDGFVNDLENLEYAVPSFSLKLALSKLDRADASPDLMHTVVAQERLISRIVRDNRSNCIHPRCEGSWSGTSKRWGTEDPLFQDLAVRTWLTCNFCSRRSAPGFLFPNLRHELLILWPG